MKQIKLTDKQYILIRSIIVEMIRTRNELEANLINKGRQTQLTEREKSTLVRIKEELITYNEIYNKLK